MYGGTWFWNFGNTALYYSYRRPFPKLSLIVRSIFNSEVFYWKLALSLSLPLNFFSLFRSLSLSPYRKPKIKEDRKQKYRNNIKSQSSFKQSKNIHCFLRYQNQSINCSNDMTSYTTYVIQCSSLGRHNHISHWWFIINRWFTAKIWRWSVYQEPAAACHLIPVTIDLFENSVISDFIGRGDSGNPSALRQINE